MAGFITDRDDVGRVPRVLVAEDEASVREFLRRGLAHAGWEVTAVADGQAALEALAAAPYDLLIADIRMPILDGIELALMATRRRPHLAVLLITGYPAERNRARNLEALTHGLLAKPFSLDALLRTARAALDRVAAGLRPAGPVPGQN